MENKVTISELPELDSVLGTESIPIDSYDDAQAKNKTFRVSVEAIKKFVESGLGEVVNLAQISAWDAKETTQGAQDKADAALVLAKEYSDEELVAVKAAISELEDLLISDDVTLDELQEIVEFIKLNRSDLDSLTTAGIAGLDAALEDKVDSATLTAALEDKADVKNNFEVVTSTGKTIVNADAGKTLFVTESCTLTVSDYASLDDGFNCKIIVYNDYTMTVEVELTGSDTMRGDLTTLEGDTTLIKSPTDGEFLLFGHYPQY